jgi:hypothetical protein
VERGQHVVLQLCHSAEDARLTCLHCSQVARHRTGCWDLSTRPQTALDRNNAGGWCGRRGSWRRAVMERLNQVGNSTWREVKNSPPLMETDGSQRTITKPQLPKTRLYSKPVESSRHSHTVFPKDSFQYYPFIYACISQVVSLIWSLTIFSEVCKSQSS